TMTQVKLPGQTPFFGRPNWRGYGYVFPPPQDGPGPQTRKIRENKNGGRQGPPFRVLSVPQALLRGFGHRLAAGLGRTRIGLGGLRLLARLEAGAARTAGAARRGLLRI